LGREPELQLTANQGTPVTKFSLAVSRTYTVRGERKEETEWFNIIAWNRLAETCEKYLHKGSKVYIEGRLTTRKYTDKEGIQRTAIEVIANDMQMLDSKSASGGTSNYAPSNAGTYSGGSSYDSAPAGDDFDPFLEADDLP
jgi:single-strand DNA-binding protein